MPQAKGETDVESLVARIRTLDHQPAALRSVLRTLDQLERGGGNLRASFSEVLSDADDEPTLKDLWLARDDELKDEALDAFDSMRGSEDGAGYGAGATGEEERRALYRLIHRELAAARIQAAWRLKKLGHDHAKMVAALGMDEGAALELPSREIARESASAGLDPETSWVVPSPACSLG